jgi:hypothetical protein
MSKTIEVKCSNTQHCGHVNIFSSDDLVSGMSIKDDEGRVVEEHPPVTVDKNTFVKCESCGYPISCGHARISD